ncbi:MAG: hypothetical protein V4590_07150 [Bacteroidota bacterium]
MAQEFNLNLRGALLTPEAKQSINYYLCLITMPTLPNGAQPVFTPVYPTDTDPSGVLNYTYDGIFEAISGNSYSDYMLPIYANQMVQNVTSVNVTDSAGNYTKGDPNSRIPPVAPIAADRNSNYTPANQVFIGQYNRANCFVLVMVSTAESDFHPTGGYKNTFGSYTPVTSEQGLVMQCQMTAVDGLPARAVIGAFPSANGQYAYTQAIDKSGVGGSSLVIHWDPNGIFPPIDL